MKRAKAQIDRSKESGGVAGPELLLAVGGARERVKAIINSADRAIETNRVATCRRVQASER